MWRGRGWRAAACGPRGASVSEDRERAIRIAAEVLKAEGERVVYLFWTLAKGREWPESDIDLAVSGLPERKFFHAMACAHEAAGWTLDDRPGREHAVRSVSSRARRATACA